MEVYFGLIIVVLLIYLVPSKRVTKIYFIALILILFSGLRECVGTDFNMYKNIFYNLNNLENYYLGEIEKGYVLLNKVLYSINQHHRILFIGTSAMIVGLIFNCIYKYSKNYLLSILLFIGMGYYHSSFNGIRQYIALAIFVYSIRFIINKNFKKYVICIFIAILFHNTAVMMLPIYFINRIRFNKKRFLLTIIPILLIGFSYKFIISNLNILSPHYYQKYLNNKYLSLGVGGITNYIYIISFIVIYIISILRYNSIIVKYENVRIFIILCGISISFMLLGLKSLLFFRISLYFSIFYIFLIPMIIDTLNIKLRLAIYPIGIVWLFYFYTTTLLYRDGAIPYIWNLM